MTHRNDRYAEAAERPVYTALNILRVDLGSANYGSVGVVFSRHAVDPMLLLAPVDTGSWELRCNSSAPDWLKAQFPVNCAPWQDQSLVRYNIGVWTSLCVGCALTFVCKNKSIFEREGLGRYVLYCILTMHYFGLMHLSAVIQGAWNGRKARSHFAHKLEILERYCRSRCTRKTAEPCWDKTRWARSSRWQWCGQ